MNNINISFASTWILWLIIPVIIITFIPLLFIKKSRRFSLKNTSAFLVRSIALLLIFLLLSGFTVSNKSNLTSVVVLVDLSDSMASYRTEMKEFVNSFVEKLDNNTQIGMVGFGYNTVNEVAMDYIDNMALDKGFYRIKAHPMPSSSATNIESALSYAAELLPEGTNKRIIILSDGYQTDGFADNQARKLANDGIRIDVVDFEGYDKSLSEIQVNNIELPLNAYNGDLIDVTVTLQSNIDGIVMLNLYDKGPSSAGAAGEILVESIVTEVKSGENIFTIKTTVGVKGIHSYRVEAVLDDDTIKNNNSVYSYLKVSGDPNVLIIDGIGRKDINVGDKTLVYNKSNIPLDSEINNWQEAHEIIKFIAAQDYTCTVVSPKDIPNTLNGLKSYDEIIMMNVNADDLPKNADNIIQEYVSRFGRGLFTTGGANTYIYGAMSETRFEDMLPINFQLDPDEMPASSVVIIIDKSGSMNGTKFNMAKKGAIRSINCLNDKDYVGVIAFSGSADIVVDLTTLYDRKDIIEAVANINMSHGTTLNEATRFAYDMLNNATTETKHVIILSDGNPTDGGYYDVIREMADNGITVSSIAVGSDANTRIMEQISKFGNGKFYSVTNPNDLPQVMINEALSTHGNYINENISFSPSVNTFSQVLKGIDYISGLPKLTGYISASEKDRATTVLRVKVDGKDFTRPIYAEWQYGLGRVASFTSDLNGGWSKEWMASAEGKTFIMNVISSILPSDNDNSDMSINVDVYARSADITITTNDTFGEKYLVTKIESPSAYNSNTILKTNMTSPGVYTGTIALSADADKGKGIYTVSVSQYESEEAANSMSAPLDSIEKAFAVSYSSEYNFFAEKSTLLTDIAMITGGISALNPDELADVPSVPMDDVIDTFTPIVITIALLLLLDIVIRKIRIKDIKRLFKLIYSVQVK